MNCTHPNGEIEKILERGETPDNRFLVESRSPILECPRSPPTSFAEIAESDSDRIAGVSHSLYWSRVLRKDLSERKLKNSNSCMLLGVSPDVPQGWKIQKDPKER